MYYTALQVYTYTTLMIDRRSVPQTAYLIDVFGQDGATESKADAVGMCRMTWRKPTVSKFDGMCRMTWRKPTTEAD